MTTTTAPASGSKLKDLVVTATVATVVSALVSPWVRRWLDGPHLPTGAPAPLPNSDEPTVAAVGPDVFETRVERLLDVPNPFADRVLGETEDHTRRSTDDEDDEDE